MMPRRFSFLSCPMDALDMRETLRLIEDAIIKRKNIQHGAINVAKLVSMQGDKKLREDVCASDIINIDGMGVVWGARLCGHKVPERVSGVDIMENLLLLCAQKGYRPYFLGGRQEVIETAIKNIREEYPALAIAGFRNGYFTAGEEPGIAEEISSSRADCLFIAISSPIKERFLAQYKHKMNVPFIMGVGGSLDIKAGITKRAPRWMQRHGLEWFYRLWQEPKRMFKRYLTTNTRYAGLLVIEIFKTGLGGKRAARINEGLSL